MRDPKRINPIIDAVRNIWYQNPNMRFGQILVAVTGKEDPFYVEDDILLEKLTTGIESQEMPTADPARIERFLTALRNVWEKVPDWRLCQLAVNFSYNHGLKYIDDDVMMFHLRKAGE